MIDVGGFYDSEAVAFIALQKGEVHAAIGCAAVTDGAQRRSLPANCIVNVCRPSQAERIVPELQCAVRRLR
ncbi:hypothetical protein ABMA59_19505 [Mesorhizobium sp. CN2-181]